MRCIILQWVMPLTRFENYLCHGQIAVGKSWMGVERLAMLLQPSWWWGSLVFELNFHTLDGWHFFIARSSVFAERRLEEAVELSPACAAAAMAADAVGLLARGPLTTCICFSKLQAAGGRWLRPAARILGRRGTAARFGLPSPRAWNTDYQSLWAPDRPPPPPPPPLPIGRRGA